MKPVAFLFDVHGNLQALERVLADIKRVGEASYAFTVSTVADEDRTHASVLAAAR